MGWMSAKAISWVVFKCCCNTDLAISYRRYEESELKYFLNYGVSIAILLFAFSAHAQQFPKGKWEVTTQTIMPHIMTPMPIHTDVICVNDKTKGKPPIAVHESCEFFDYKIIDNDASWQMKCKGELKMNGAGRIIFSSDKYKGSAIIKMKMPESEPMEIDHTYTGRRIGDC